MNSERSFKEKYGRWAFVTGASSGIGAEFARQLAKHGLNVAVTARRKSRLESLVEELQETHGIRVRALAVDLTAPDFLEAVEVATEDIEIGLLVNNAGAGIPGAFIKQSLQDYTGSVQLYVMAPM